MTFAQGFVSVFRAVLSTFALASIVVLAVVLYGFYYPAPYAHQTARQLPVVVVDEERSTLTRALVRKLSDMREVRVAGEALSIHEAEQRVRRREADGILLLPRGLTRSLLTGAPGSAGGGGIGIWVNGTYLIRAKDIGGAIQAAALAVAAERLGPLAQGLHLRAPVAVVERPLFNTREGYADYVFPAVAAIILQQTLLFGTAMLAAGMAAEMREGRAPPLSPQGFLGTWCALSLIGCLAALFYFGWIFWYQDVPRAGNPAALLMAVPLFAAAVSALGLLLGSLFDSADRALQVLIPSSIILFFLAGAAWPLSAMPRWVAGLAHLSPATSGAQAFLRLNEMGASLGQVLPQLAGLVVLSLVYGAMAAWRLTGTAYHRRS
ncbi:ABC-2 type transport system permease protein [Novosphingobium sp. PhB57]|uniref:ABC transporter permease n=1 Tax=Novosphingobium sp. PhB57 TaxID=2485107 RepID=UPI0010482D24|nr:ABC transporter permease [Novosphingobium sp. PhB57]TCU61489.1 ABC-2 type transport system permease protein [Novosphingobium sp. PhB57]